MLTTTVSPCPPASTLSSSTCSACVLATWCAYGPARARTARVGASIRPVTRIVTGLSPAATVYALACPARQSDIPPDRGRRGLPALRRLHGCARDERPAIVGHSNGGHRDPDGYEPQRASRLVLVTRAGIRPRRTPAGTAGWQWRRSASTQRRFLGPPGRALRALSSGVPPAISRGRGYQPTLVRLVNRLPPPIHARA